MWKVRVRNFWMMQTSSTVLLAVLFLSCFSKEISGFAALKRTIRQVEKSPGDDSQTNKSQRRLHKKKKDVMISPKKPPNAWTAFLNEKLQEVGISSCTNNYRNLRTYIV